MKKRIISILLVIGFTFAMTFTGCGDDYETAQPEVSIAAASSEEVSAESVDIPITSADSSEETDVQSIPDEDGADASSESTETQAASSRSSAEEEPSAADPQTDVQEPEEDTLSVEEDGEYTDKDHVALYIHEYGHLPSNYVTKKEAMAAGWENREGNLNTVLPGKSIGGDRFGNYEGLLPDEKGRKYYECDIDFNPEGLTSEPVYRNEKRIIFSNDGLVFYTDDHYNSFEQLY